MNTMSFDMGKVNPMMTLMRGFAEPTTYERTRTSENDALAERRSGRGASPVLRLRFTSGHSSGI
jgi:hypothetical protein